MLIWFWCCILGTQCFREPLRDIICFCVQVPTPEEVTFWRGWRLVLANHWPVLQFTDFAVIPNQYQWIQLFDNCRYQNYWDIQLRKAVKLYRHMAESWTYTPWKAELRLSRTKIFTKRRDTLVYHIPYDRSLVKRICYSRILSSKMQSNTKNWWFQCAKV